MFHPLSPLAATPSNDKLGCPNCGNPSFYAMPPLGPSTNIKCAGCGLWFNHTPFGLDFIGIKGNVGEHKKIVWYCPTCYEVQQVNLSEHRSNWYPTCSCGSPLKVCWSYKDFPKENCDECDNRFECYTNRGDFDETYPSH